MFSCSRHRCRKRKGTPHTRVPRMLPIMKPSRKCSPVYVYHSSLYRHQMLNMDARSGDGKQFTTNKCTNCHDHKRGKHILTRHMCHDVPTPTGTLRLPGRTLQRSCRSWSSGFQWPGLKKDTEARASRRDTSYRLVGPSCRSRRSPGAAQSTDPNDFLATVQHFLDSQLYLCVREQGSLLEQPQQSVTTDYYDGVN